MDIIPSKNWPKFLSIVKPGWYFNLQTYDKLQPLNSSSKDGYSIGYKYIYDKIVTYEAERVYKGLIEGELLPFNLLTDQMVDEPTLEDEYRFIKRHFKEHWGLYVLMFRLITFNNPFREISAFFSKKSSCNYVQINKRHLFYNYLNFESPLVKDNPKVSIVIPTLNRYEYLQNGLKDLENQDFNNIEILVYDQAKNFKPEFYKQFDLDIKVIHQQEKALWKARNEAIIHANGNYILLYDDDSRVETDWVRQHLKCLDYFQADISAGVSFSQVGGQISESHYYFRYADQFDTGNAMVRKEVFYTTGLFDRQFEKQRMGDGEFGLRAYLHGFKSISNPKASRLHLKVGEGGLREMGSWDAFRPKFLFAPRPVPSVLYLFRKYFPKRNVYSALIQGTLPSLIPYRFKGNKKLLPLAIGSSIIFSPILLIGIIRAWVKSSKMLREGHKIDLLK